MMHKAILALWIMSFLLLSTTARAIPGGRERVELLDIDGNPLPLEAMNALYFKVKGTTLNASQFTSTFGRQLLANLTIEYRFLDRNWSLGFAVRNVSGGLYKIYLELKDASMLSLRFYNVTEEYAVLPHVASIASVVSDPAFEALKIEVELDDAVKPLKFALKGGSMYIPLTNNKNQTYPWFLKVYYKEILLESSKLAELMNGTPLEIPILAVPRQIELSPVLGVDPSCNITIRLSCGNITLINTPPQLTLRSSHRWVQLKTETCQVEYILEGKVYKVCNQTLENIFHYCTPEIYLLKMILTNIDEHLILFINSSKVDIYKPEICIGKGIYKLVAFYNFSGLLLKLWEKNVTITGNYLYTVQFNFTDLTLKVGNKGCIPVVYINGTPVHPRRVHGDTYEIKRLPLLPVNITTKVCELNLILNISSGNIEMIIDLPPHPVHEQLEIIELIPLFIIFSIIILQIFLLIFLLFRLRGD